jgi:hypothetical protein
MSYTSNLERLSGLPEVFTLKTAASMLGCEKGMASTYIARWKKKNLVTSLGDRTGVHFNLLRNPDASDEYRMEAIAYVYPGCLRGGVGALHHAGWTTQIPQEMDLMVHSRRSYPGIDDVAVHGRPLSWIRTAREWIDEDGPIPVLNPAFALADCVSSGIWRPDPDDIEWEEVSIIPLREAFKLFEVEIPDEWYDEIEYATRAQIEATMV